MRQIIMTVLAVGYGLFLSACGSGGTSNPNSGASQDVAVVKAVLNVQSDKTTYQPAMVGDSFVSLSDGTKAVSIEKKHVAKIFWNGAAVGWHIFDSSKGVDLQYRWNTNPVFTIAGQPLSPTFGGNFSFLLDDGRELSQITDSNYLTITVGVGMIAERKADGLIYSSAGASPVATVQAKTVVNVNTASGEVEITPSMLNDTLINLVSSNPTEKVLDSAGKVIVGYRIAWNDNGSWYSPTGGGKLATLILPKTSILSAAKSAGMGSGMPYLVRPDGTFVAFNTDPTVCTFTVNGVVTKINTDGLMVY